MKSAIIKKKFNLPFDEVYERLRANIIKSGFLLLHEINTQAIVAKHDIKINPLKQLLFFHPRYIHEIVAGDVLAINEIPIKIVVYQESENQISVSCPDPTIGLRDYDIKENISTELLNIINKILTI